MEELHHFVHGHLERVDTVRDDFFVKGLEDEGALALVHSLHTALEVEQVSLDHHHVVAAPKRDFLRLHAAAHHLIVLVCQHPAGKVVSHKARTSVSPRQLRTIVIIVRVVVTVSEELQLVQSRLRCLRILYSRTPR